MNEEVTNLTPNYQTTIVHKSNQPRN